MEEALGKEIIQAVEDADGVFISLEEKIDRIEDPNERKQFRRALGELIALMDSEISYPIRIQLGLTAQPK